MLETQHPVDVIATLRTAQRLLTEEADRLRQQAASQADYGAWGPTQRYRQLRDCAADLSQLAELIALGTER
jgi:hypothetical protein